MTAQNALALALVLTGSLAASPSSAQPLPPVPVTPVTPAAPVVPPSRAVPGFPALPPMPVMPDFVLPGVDIERLTAAGV
jgi:hypothetical protein